MTLEFVGANQTIHEDLFLFINHTQVEIIKTIFSASTLFYH
jgi:hypothetical protein